MPTCQRMPIASAHLRCHGNAADEEDDAHRERGEETDALVQAKSRKFVDEASHNRFNQHHLQRNTHTHTHTHTGTNRQHEH